MNRPTSTIFDATALRGAASCLAVAGLATLAGCNKGQPEPAPASVAALSSVEVKPQVSAQVLAVHVKEGQFVQRGQALWPGAYVTVKMALQTLPDAIVVPQAAIVQGARGTVVFTAGPGNLALIRPVKVLASAGTEAVVTGLRPGERIVLDGRQNVRSSRPLIERAAEPGRAG